MTRYERNALAVQRAYIARDGHCLYTLAELVQRAKQAELFVDDAEALENRRVGS